MARTGVPDGARRVIPFRWASVLGLSAAAAMFLGSAVLQFMASLQRWVVFSGSRASERRSAEDHLYDYSFPYAPWQPIGTAAELYGTGILLVALGVLALPLGLSAVVRTAGNRVLGVAVIVSEIVLAILVAGSFALQGAHALLSGASGTPSPLQDSGASGLVGIVGLGILAAIWRASRAALIACVLLIGATGLGYFVAAFIIAPVFAGGTSHDTTPWTETVVAIFTAGAGVAVILAAVRRGPATAPAARLPWP